MICQRFIKNLKKFNSKINIKISSTFNVGYSRLLTSDILVILKLRVKL